MYKGRVLEPQECILGENPKARLCVFIIGLHESQYEVPIGTLEDVAASMGNDDDVWTIQKAVARVGQLASEDGRYKRSSPPRWSVMDAEWILASIEANNQRPVAPHRIT